MSEHQHLHTSRLAVYWPPWQVIRIELLGTWTTMDKVNANIEMLKEYLREHRNVTDYWRVINYMNAIRMGLSGQQKFLTEASLTIAAFRDDILETYNDMTSAGDQYEAYTDDQFVEEWGKLSQMHKTAITRDLKKRLARRMGDSSKLELEHFLILIGEHSK